MRCVLVLAALAACKPGGVTQAQETCARAAAMFERCEDFGSDTPLERDLAIDQYIAFLQESPNDLRVPAVRKTLAQMKNTQH